MTDELSHLVDLLRGQEIAIGVDDVARIAAVLHHTRDWPHDRRVRALKTLLAKSSDERDRFDHVAPVLFAPRAEGDGPAPPPTAPEPAAEKAEMPRPHHPRADPRRRWLLVAGGVALIAAFAIALYAVRQAPGPTPPTDAPTGPPPAAPSPAVDPHQTVPEPSSLPATLRGAAAGFGVASLLLVAWSLLAWRSDRRRDLAIDGLVHSSGRRTAGVHADRAGLCPIDRRTISSLAHMLAAPAPSALETALDPGATVEETARNAGRLTLCYERERQQPPLILIEDVSRSMERWPAHAAQLARAIEAQGQPVERRFMAGDPMQICDRRSLDGRTERLEDLSAGGRVVVVSDGAHFDREPARMACPTCALEGTIWLQPRPGELWRSGARWLNGHAFARTLAADPGSLTSPTSVAPVWHPPRPRADANETADAWRSALTDDAYFAFAATALLDLATSWSTTLVWALISDGIIAPPWQEFDRIWDLPEMAVLPGGRIRLAPELRDRLLADVRGARPELLARVAHWIDARLASAIEAAGDGSLGATVGEVYLDRVARAAGLDDSGARVRKLARRGLSSVVATHLGDDEREAWGVRDPHAALTARLRTPLLALALLGTAGFGVASVVAPAWQGASRTAPSGQGKIATPDHGTAIDGPVDARGADAAPLDARPRDARPVDARPPDAIEVGSGSDGRPPGEGRGRVVFTDSSIEVVPISFEDDKAIVAPRLLPILDAVAATLQANPSIELLEISAHTDERGDDAHNLELSEGRAEAVMSYLLAKGIDKKRLTARGYGATRPIDRGHDEAAWAKNRRVEFVIRKGTLK